MPAAIWSPMIMMSQNRNAARDRLQASQDFEANVHAEPEITGLDEKIDRLPARLEAPAGSP